MQILRDYVFRDEALQREALTRRSWVEEGGDGPHNERLEFLGDAVIELLVTELLVDLRPECNEGELSQMRSALVREEALARFAREAGLGAGLRMGRGDEKSLGRDHPSILADAFEATLAAIFKDSGMDAARAIMRQPLTDLILAMPKGGLRDPKSQLQELSMQTWRHLPVYTQLSRGGEAHNTRFEFSVAVGPEGEPLVTGLGEGRSRQIAQREAATDALRQLAERGL